MKHLSGFVLLSLVLGGICTLVYLIALSTSAGQAPLLLILSLDAFKPEFLHRPQTTNLQRIAEKSRYGSMVVQFPSFTFTNHWTMMMGLTPAKHGIVGSRFYDQKLNQSFSYKNANDTSNPIWWQGTPIWALLSRAGRRSATLFWPGDQAHPSPLHRSIPFDKGMRHADRVLKAFDWLDEDPTLSMLTIYANLVDDAGHRFGPDSAQMNATLIEADQLVLTIEQQLRARGLWGRVNLLIVSDHGLSQAQPEPNVLVGRYVSELASLVDFIDYSVCTSVFPREGVPAQRVYKAVQEAILSFDLPLELMWTESAPAEWRIKETARLGPILLMAKPGFTLARDDSRKSGGFHGYDPRLPDMRSFILGFGPAFSQIGTFDQVANNLDVYNLLASLLRIPAGENDGGQRLSQLMLHRSNDP